MQFVSPIIFLINTLPSHTLFFWRVTNKQSRHKADYRIHRLQNTQHKSRLGKMNGQIHTTTHRETTQGNLGQLEAESETYQTNKLTKTPGNTSNNNTPVHINSNKWIKLTQPNRIYVYTIYNRFLQMMWYNSINTFGAFVTVSSITETQSLHFFFENYELNHSSGKLHMCWSLCEVCANMLHMERKEVSPPHNMPMTCRC